MNPLQRHVAETVRQHLQPDLTGRVLRAVTAPRGVERPTWQPVVALLGTLSACSLALLFLSEPAAVSVELDPAWRTILVASQLLKFHL